MIRHVALLGFLFFAVITGGWAQSGSIAAGFAGLPKGRCITLMPPDVELFSISAGGVLEPRADWTSAAQGFLQNALHAHLINSGLRLGRLTDNDIDALSDLLSVHAAVSRAIALHGPGGPYRLPSKEGRLDWTLGDAIVPLKTASDCDFALWLWMRDSYASAERKATMAMLALVGVLLPGGTQQGVASLVDLRDGRVVWFNRLARVNGDLREVGTAAETVATVMRDFPVKP